MDTTSIETNVMKIISDYFENHNNYVGIKTLNMKHYLFIPKSVGKETC